MTLPRVSPWVLATILAGTAAVAGRAELLVEAVPPGSPPALAGLVAGDVLVAWSRPSPRPGEPPASGRFGRWSDFAHLITEQAPRGPLRLAVLRGGEPVELQVPAGDWTARVRPRLDRGGETALAEATALQAAGEVDAAIEILTSLAACGPAEDPDLAAWAGMRRGGLFAANRRPGAAAAAFHDAAEAAAAAGDPAGQGAALVAAARMLLVANDVAAADAALDTAAAVVRAAFPASLSLARTLSDQAQVASLRGDLARAETLLEETQRIEAAEVPGSIELAKTLNNLSLVRMDRGDLLGAESLRRRSHRLIAALAPGSLLEAQALNNLATVSAERGDLAAAEELYRRSLELKERLAAEDADIAQTVMNLGLLALDRADPEQAASRFRHALERFSVAVPNGPDVANARVNLGNAAVASGDLATAEREYRSAREIYRALAPDGVDEAGCLANLAAVARRRGELATARELLEAASRIWEREAPGGLEHAETLRGLGNLAADHGQHAAAEALLRRALERVEALAPGSAQAASCRHDLARTLRAAGRPADAAAELFAAAAALEEQTRRLGGGDEAGARFRAAFRPVYTDLIDLLLGLGRPADAFAVVERARARVFLTMLAARDLTFAAEIGPELARRRALLAREHRDALAALGRAEAAATREELQALRARIADVRAAQTALEAEIRAVSPRVAALREPPALDLDSVRASLEPGTVLAEFVVEPDRTLLFVVRRGADLAVVPIAVSEAELRRRVGRFHAAVQAAALGEVDLADLERASATLYELLITPMATALADAHRLVVVADGPLHRLPFAALGRPQGEGFRYLLEDLPVSGCLSATVLAELMARPAPRAGRAVLLADPAYPEVPDPDAVANLAVRSALRRGFSLRPLPATGEEADAVAAALGPRAAVHRHADATEARAKTSPADTAILHFACHGLLDEDDPLASSLALAFPLAPEGDEEDGLLAAWEIVEGSRLDLDLVTLSACQTGLGRTIGDEGVVGLARAFQFAGARTVVASLWSVADDSTAALMRAFYRELAAGRAKDEALRTAQLELLRAVPSGSGAGFRHPFHWAAFTVVGAYR